jgi:hypothetical protein
VASNVSFDPEVSVRVKRGGKREMSEGRSIVDLVLRGVGLAMGVAVVVLSILNAADASTLVILLGIGLFALGLDALNRDN